MIKKILLIADNLQTRKNVIKILELANYNVLVAKNGKAGMEQAIKNSPDLIICDINLLPADGYTVLHSIHQHVETKNIPFILLCVENSRINFRKGMEMGADDCISNPFRNSALLNAVEARLKKIDLLKEQIIKNEQCRVLNEVVTVNSVIESADIRVYKKGQLIYEEGAYPNKLFFLLKGKVKAYVCNPDGKKLIIDLFGPGDFLGYVPLFGHTVYKDSSLPIEDSELAVISSEHFEKLIRHYDVLYTFANLLAKNILARESQLLGVAYNTIRKKVAATIITIQEKYPDLSEAGSSVKFSRENLATMFGLATETVIRTLSEFHREKIIEIQKAGSFVVLNKQRLKAMCN